MFITWVLINYLRIIEEQKLNILTDEVLFIRRKSLRILRNHELEINAVKIQYVIYSKSSLDIFPADPSPYVEGLNS